MSKLYIIIIYHKLCRQRPLLSRQKELPHTACASPERLCTVTRGRSPGPPTVSPRVWAERALVLFLLGSHGGSGIIKLCSLFRSGPLCESLWLPKLHPSPGGRAAPADGRPSADPTRPPVFTAHHRPVCRKCFFCFCWGGGVGVGWGVVFL